MTRPDFIKLTDEQVRARKRRNVAIALGLVGFIVLVYPAMLCWMVMAYHVAMPGELPANGGGEGRDE